MIYIVLILAFVLRHILANQSFWLDEGATLVISNRPFMDIFGYLATDFHPPLYYLITNLLLKLGLTSEVTLRLPNIAFGVLTIYFLYRLLELLNGKINFKIFSHKVPFPIIGALLLTLNPLHIYYSQELRMYSLSAMLATLTWLLLIKWNMTKSNKHLVLFTIFTTTNLFTFYGAVFNLGAQLIYVIIYHRKMLNRFLLSTLVVSVCFVPWIPTLQAQFAGSAFLKSLPGWTTISGELSLKSLFLIPAKFSFGRINFSTSKSLLLVGGVTTFYYLSLMLLSLRQKVSRLFIIWLSVPIVLAAIFSLSSPMLGYWRYIYLIPAFTALMALGISQLPPKLANLNLMIIIFTALFANYVFWTTPAFHREDWRSATRFVMEQQQDQNAQSIFAFADAFAPVLWYQPELRYIAPLKDLNEDPSLLDLRLSQGTNGKSDVYYFHYLSELTDPSHNISTWLNNAGYTLTSTQDFNGVGFVDHFQAQ